jgi:hypothetical protein
VDVSGEVAARNVVRDYAHCEWRRATFLAIGSATYIRDPGDEVLRDGRWGTTGTYEPDAALPMDATGTWIHNGDRHIWTSRSLDPEAIFVVGPEHTERWPLTTAACLD